MSPVTAGYLWRVALWAGLYYAAARISLLGPLFDNASLVWLPTGVGLAVILLNGYRFWPAIALGSLVTLLRISPPFVYLVGVIFAHTIDAVVGAWILKRFARFQPALTKLRDVLALLLVGAVLGPMAGATVMAGATALAGTAGSQNLASVWFILWLGKLMGVLIVTPAALTWAHQRGPWGRRLGLVGLTALLGGLIFAVGIFSDQSDTSFAGYHLLEYSVFPLLIWTALRYGTLGASTGNFLLSIGVIWGGWFLAGIGTRVDSLIDLLWLPALLLVMSITSLVVGAVTHEQREAVREVRRSEEKFLRLFLSIPYSAALTRMWDGKYLDVNEAFERATGYRRDEVIGRTVVDLGIVEGQASRKELVRALREENRVQDFEFQYRVKSGEIREALLAAQRIEIEGEECILGVSFDITERKRVEEALRENEERFRSIFDNAPVGMVVRGLDGKLVRVNRAYCDMVGYTPAELEGLSVLDLTHPDDRNESRERMKALLEGEIDSFTMAKQYLRKDGSCFPALTSAAVIHDAAGRVSYSVAQIQDVTARHALEEQVRETQKMEAIGQLAGGIAHDFNNLMMVVQGYNELILKQLTEDSPLRKSAEEIQTAAGRAASLTQQLLAYGRRQMLQPEIFDFNKLVADSTDVLRHLLAQPIEITVNLEPSLAPVKADPGQLKQVLYNLALNAGDAMPSGGVLSIRTANREIDGKFAGTIPDLKSGPYVELAVQDTGVGMDTETLSRIFEPFFTTHDRARNPGLGLASVYGIVKQSGGHIRVESAKGKGTTFYLYLPQAKREQPGEEISPAV